MIEDIATIKSAFGYLVSLVVALLSMWAKSMSGAISRIEEKINGLPKDYVQRHEYHNLQASIERLDEKLDARFERLQDLLMERKK